MSKIEIEEYKQFEAELRDNLEQQYNLYMMQGNKIDAHETVKTMMEYGVIPKDDPRTSVKANMFGGADGVNVKDSSSWGQFDYRRKDNLGYIPRYLFCKIANYEVFYVDTLEHWGKRVEGEHVGDIRIEAGTTKIKLTQDNLFTQARRDFEEIVKVFQSNKKSFPNPQDMLDMINAGVVRVFNIEVVGNIISKYRTLGYVLVKMDDTGRMTARTIIKYEALYNSWINIREFMTKVENAIHNIVKADITVSHIIPAKEGIERQDSMCKATPIMDKQRAETLKKQEMEAAAKAAAKAEKAAKEISKKAVKKS